MLGATCKGSYLLGSACGKCQRCKNELASLKAKLSMNELIPAKAAKIISQQIKSQQESTSSQMTKILSLIQNAIQDGCFHCSSDFAMNNEVLALLTEMGYTTFNVSDIEGYIRWD